MLFVYRLILEMSSYLLILKYLEYVYSPNSPDSLTVYAAATSAYWTAKHFTYQIFTTMVLDPTLTSGLAMDPNLTLEASEYPTRWEGIKIIDFYRVTIEKWTFVLCEEALCL